MNKKLGLGFVAASALLLSTTGGFAHGSDADDLRDLYDSSIFRTDKVEFPQVVGTGDPVMGQRRFGFADDGVTLDDSLALFEGFSIIKGPVVSNGRTCASCHRAGTAVLGMPPIPISSTIPPDDPLITGVAADSQENPDGPPNLENHGLVMYRPGRFNPTLPEGDPFRTVFFWRRSIRLVNTVFQFGFLNDGRMRHLSETARGAIFSHTNEENVRFDDVANPFLDDLAAFIEAQIHPPELKALIEPNNPLRQTLIDDPFYTVHAETRLEKKGQRLFAKNCMGCHNMPNVFANLDHQIGLPLNLAPAYGHSFDIGVSQKNFKNLEFRLFDPATGTRKHIILPLVKEDGTLVQHKVVDDIGLAGATGRYEDLHRFKVPQLRRIREIGPYFHDNSMETLEDVVDYFDSDAYNRSADGRKYPIHLNSEEKKAIVAFLKIL